MRHFAVPAIAFSSGFCAAIVYLAYSLQPDTPEPLEHRLVEAIAGMPAASQMWAISVGVQAGTWVLGSVLTVGILLAAPRGRGRVKELGFPTWIEIAVGVVLLAAVVGVVFVLFLNPEFERHEARPGLEPTVGGLGPILSKVSLLAGAIPIAGIWIVHAVAKRCLRPENLSSGMVDTYLRLKSKLIALLSIAASVVALGVIGSGFLHIARSQAQGPAYDVSSSYLVVHGALYTALLALAYAPSHVLFMRIGSGLRDDLAPVRVSRARSWSEQESDRAALGRILGMRRAGLSQIKALLPIMAPLVSGLIGALLKR